MKQAINTEKLTALETLLADSAANLATLEAARDRRDWTSAAALAAYDTILAGARTSYARQEAIVENFRAA